MMFTFKAIKYFAVLFLSILGIFSCFKAGNKPAIQKGERKIKVDTVITKSTILLLGPDKQELEEIKKKQGEDNFYTLADDANYYSAEIFEATPAAIYTGYKIIDFPNESYVFDKNKSENKWLVIDYKEGSKPKIYSLVDYYLYVTQKQSPDK